MEVTFSLHSIISLILSFITIILDIYFHETDRLDDKKQEINTYINIEEDK